MSYDENDAARDEFYEQLSRELYDDHKQQAIEEVLADRLKSLAMTITVFFSWQADTSTKEGRNLVERALESAISRIGADTAIEPAVREIAVDRDTKGVAGSPPIADTIFQKIDAAAVFVPDLTFVGKRLDGRPTPNPNVLIEYGWALKSLGHARIVPVMNIAAGEPTAEAMPFNLRHRRNPIRYNCPNGADEATCKQAREGLAKQLERALRDVLNSDDFRESLPKPPEPLAFPAHKPEDGPGRFRARGQPLGVSHDPLDPLLKRPSRDVKLSDKPVIWLRVMPAVDPGRTWLFTELEDAAKRGGRTLLPLTRDNWTGFSYLRAEDGFGSYASINDDASVTDAAVFAFTTGEVWTLDSYVLDMMARNGRNAVPPTEPFFRQALIDYVDFLSRLGAKPPFRWIAGMENLKGRGLFFAPPPRQMWPHSSPRGTCISDIVAEEGLHRPGDPPAQSLKPFFTKLFDKCGVARPEYLDR